MAKILFLDDSRRISKKGIFRRRPLVSQGKRLFQLLLSEGLDVREFYLEKDLYKSIPDLRPQLVIVDENASAFAAKLMMRYPFIPVVIYGEFIRGKKINSLLKKGADRCLKAPFEKENVLPAVKEALWSSIAKEELWDNQRAVSVSENRGRKFGSAFTVIFSLAVVAALLLGSKDRLFTLHNTIYTRVYATPYPNPTGITLYGNDLWVSDWKTQNIYMHSLDSSFSILRIYSFPEERFTGLVFGAGYLWTCDPWAKKIYKYTVGSEFKVVASYDSPGPNPVAIDFDGKYLWVCDNGTDSIYQLNLDEKLSVVNSYDSPVADPAGIFCEGRYVWTADSQTNRIYRMRIGERLSVDSVFVPPAYVRISSIDGDGDYLWICSEKESKIYRYPRKLLESVE